MHSFYGSQCPYCKKNFAEGDDIVVCPECGTPHHRECYKEHSACANEAHHAENFEWKPAFAPAPGVRHEHVHEAENVNSAEKTTVCPTCGSENPSGSRFCFSCGARLSAPDNHVPSAEDFHRERQRMYSEAFGDSLDGISAKEAAIYVRSNIEYFLPRFAAFSKGAKFDTNFSAFIFSYFYLFYRKMYGLGFAVLAAVSILNIPTLLLDLVTIQEQYVEMGLLSQVIWEIPHQQTLAIYAIIANFLIWGIRIALMLFFNRLYFAKLVKNIKGAREKLASQSEKAVADFFRKKGGTSMVLPIILALISFSASFVLAGFIVSSEFFIMPDMANFL